MAGRDLLAVILSSAVVVTLLSSSKGTVHFRDCQDGVVTLRETSYIYLYCYDLYGPAGVIKWTLTSDNGSTITLGTCNAPDDCTANDGNLGVYWQYRLGSRLYIRNISKDLSGTVHCNIIRNDMVDTASCQINVVRITTDYDVHNLLQDTSGSIYFFCYVSTLRPSTASWTWKKDTGVTALLGTCYDNNTCTSLTNDFTLGRSSSYSYAMTRSAKRELAGHLVCSFTYQSQTETADMILNVVSRPQLESCTVAVSHHNWSAVLTCDFRNAFSSAGIYLFQVTETRSSRPDYLMGSSFYTHTSGSDGRSLETKKHGWVSLRDGLRSYVNTTDYQTYYKGRLWYSWRLSPCQGEDTKVTVDVCASTRNSYCAKSDHFLLPTILPDRPRHNCTELSHVPETGATTCVCTSGNLGYPAGRLVWLLGNVPVATGGYGVSHLVLPPSVLTRDEGPVLVTCRLDWIEPQDVSLSLEIAYTTGPQNASSHNNSNNLKWAGIGVATTLGIVVVVILVVVLVVWTCRHGHPDYPKPKGRQGPYNSDTDTHLYEGLHTNSNRGRRLPPEPNQDNVYENAAVEEREAHM